MSLPTFLQKRIKTVAFIVELWYLYVEFVKKGRAVLNVSDAHILIVDDQQLNIDLIRRILHATPYSLSTTLSGHEALSWLEREPFDLVLLDIMMPGISGLDVLQQIRQSHAPSDLPVILVSALKDPSDIQQGLELGANDYITKPVNPSILRARIKTQLMLKQLADERRSVVEQLEHANMLHRRLMRIASHDLKNPLHNISMAHTLLLDLMRDDPMVSEMLQMAQKSTESMIEIVQEFLDMDVVRGDQIDVNLQTTNTSALISEVVLENQQAANDKSIDIQVDFSDHLIVADPARLKQVLNNLVSNAVKYSPFNSVIQVFAEHLPDGVYIHVVDHGPGIPPDEHDQLFQAFANISTKPTAGEHSTGLGLWIAQQMMVVQNGDIGLKTPPEGGADFWVKLPPASVGKFEKKQYVALPTQ